MGRPLTFREVFKLCLPERGFFFKWGPSTCIPEFSQIFLPSLPTVKHAPDN